MPLLLKLVECYATSFEAGRVLCHLFWPLIVLLLSREAQKGRKRPIMAGPISISISGIILTNFIGGAFLFGFYLLDYRLGPILDVAWYWIKITTPFFRLEIICGSFRKYSNYRIVTPPDRSGHDLCLLMHLEWKWVYCCGFNRWYFLFYFILWFDSLILAGGPLCALWWPGAPFSPCLPPWCPMLPPPHHWSHGSIDLASIIGRLRSAPRP